MKHFTFLDLATINRPFVQRIEQAANRVIESGRYISGPEVEALERNMEAITGAPHAVGVSNGLDALRLALMALVELGALNKGDGVIVPANTYIASVLAIADAGLLPVLVDPDPLTANLSAEGLRKGIAQGAKGVMTVHLYGRVAWDDEMDSLAKRHSLIVVEDSAQAIGARTPQGHTAGNIGIASGFSFYPTKNIGALGDAGAVTTRSKPLAEIVRSLANYGRSDQPYINPRLGFNCRLDPMQAAILNVKLPELDSENLYRRSIAKIYNEQIANPKVVLPPWADDFSMVWHQYVVRVDNREQFREYLASNGVETAVHYPLAIHQQPCFKELASASLPQAEKLCATVVSLPITRCTSPDEAAQIAKIISNY